MRDEPVQNRLPHQRFGVCRQEIVDVPEVLLALVIGLHLYDGLRHIGAGCECCGVKTFLSPSTRSTGEKFLAVSGSALRRRTRRGSSGPSR